MGAIVMDGKALAEKIKKQVADRAKQLSRRPGLAVIMAGDSPASKLYVNGKKRDCVQCGICSEEYALPEDAGQGEMLALIEQLNGREEIDGILVQMPLPGHMDLNEIITAIRPDKDVDGFHPFNIGQTERGVEGFIPCTPGGVLRLLEEYGISPEGQRCVIVGRSNIVGKPLGTLLTQRNATVTICHTATKELQEECLRADMLISAAGRPGLITPDMIRPGAVVIDVATNRNEAGALCGDVVFEGAAERAAYITPVPGGIGPLTRAMLMENTLLAACRHQR